MIQPNIILIVCDTLRKDIMDIYGGPTRMPNLRKFAQDSVVYENCIAPAPWTFPSHVSLFSGLYPSEHGIHETLKMKMREITKAHLRFKHVYLAEYLRGLGYSTFGVSANIMISRLTGFDRGFDDFSTIVFSPWIQSDTATEARNLGADLSQVLAMLIKRGQAGKIIKYAAEYFKVKWQARLLNYPVNKGAGEVNKKAMPMLRRQPFFLFLNYYESHEPYKNFSDKETQDQLTGLRQTSPEKIAYLKHQYVLGNEYMDSQIGIMLDWLKRKKLYDNSLIIITSDHGQAFNEHGYMYHGLFLYDEIVRVPLIIKYPKGKRFKPKKGYQSLTKIFDLVRDAVGGKSSDITTRFALSETFGNAESFPESYRHRFWYIKKMYEKERVAIYMDGHKLSLDSSDKKVDEFLQNSGKPADAKSQPEFKRLAQQLKELKKNQKFWTPTGK